MSTNFTMKPIAAAVGTAAVMSLATALMASADQSPFGVTNLFSVYMIADAQEDKCGEDK